MEIEIHVVHYLVISTVMLFCGIYGFFTRKNLLALLISVELMLNATNINFAVFNRYLFPGQLEGHFFSLFGIAIAAAETAVAIAIIINVYRNLKQVLTDDITDLKDNFLTFYSIAYGLYNSDTCPPGAELPGSGIGRHENASSSSRHNRYPIVRSGSRAELSDGIQLFLCSTYCRRPLPYADSVEH